MSDRILVTGSTGKVGKEVVNQLVAMGLPVRAADINVDGDTDISDVPSFVDCLLGL